jgi:hypothetical protein
VFFRATRPTWAEALHIAPHEYTLTAGWTLAADGSRRDLYLREGRAFERASEPAGPIAVLGLTDERCALCSNPLGTLFEMDLGAAELDFLPLRGDTFPIPFCHLCSCYGTLFFRVAANGRAEWHAGTKPFPVYDKTFSPWRKSLALARPLINSFEFAGWVGADVGHVGGHPGWIDDGTYPPCPDCAEYMTFIGQVDVASGGRFYALACLDCCNVATVYQQT